MLEYAGVEGICRNSAGDVVGQGIANTTELAANESRVLTMIIMEADGCTDIDVQPDGITGMFD